MHVAARRDEAGLARANQTDDMPPPSLVYTGLFEVPSSAGVDESNVCLTIAQSLDILWNRLHVARM